MEPKSVFVALFLLALTALVIFLVWKMTGGRRLDKAVKAIKETEKPKKAKKNPMTDCPLNEIMGYDFIKIQTPVSEKKEDKPKEFEDVKDDGNIDQTTIGVTGTESVREKYETEDTEEGRYIPIGKKNQNKEETKEENYPEPATVKESKPEETEDEDTTQIDRETWEMLNMEWPENENDSNEEQQAMFLDIMLSAAEGNDNGTDESIVEEISGNESDIQDKEDKEDIQNKIDQMIDNMQNNNADDNEFLKDLNL